MSIRSLHLSPRMRRAAAVMLALSAPAIAGAQVGAELLFAESGRPALLNPHANAVHTGPTDRLLSMIYEPLYRYNTDSEEYEPVLATGIQSTPARGKAPGVRGFLIDLKRGVRWHNGQAFTAADVAFTYRFIKQFGRNLEEKAELDRLIVTIEKNGTNDYQLYLELKPAGAGALDPREALEWPIIPANRFQNFQPIAPLLQQVPIGTGPFRWRDADADEPTLVANTTYHDSTKASLSPLISKEYTDAPTVAQELINQGSRLGLVVDLPTSQFNTVEASNNVAVMERLSSYKVHALAMRQQPGGNSLMNNLKVRQAITMGIDRAKLLRTRFSDKGKLMTTPYSPNSPFADVSYAGIPYDKDKAAQLVGEAGARGQTLRLLAEKTRSINKQRDDDVLADIREQLEAIGFRVRVTQVEAGEFERLKLGDANSWDVALVTVEFDAIHDISWLYHSKSIRQGGSNFMKFKDAEVDALFDRVDTSSDGAERLTLLQQVGRLIGSKVPAVFLVNEEPVYAYKRKYEINREDVDQFDFFTYAHRWRLRPRR